MAFEFRFPDLGEGIAEGELIEWKVVVGEMVKAHQVLMEVETDKAVVEVPSPVAGMIVSLKGEPGDLLQVGEVIAVIEEDASPDHTVERPEPVTAPLDIPDDIPIPGAHPGAHPEKVSVTKKESVGVVGELEEAPEEEESTEKKAEPDTPLVRPRVEALPKDRALAKSLNVDIELVRGTGTGGRVTEKDVREAARKGGMDGRKTPEQPGTLEETGYGPLERVPVRGVRRKIADAMVESLTKAAQVTTVDEADVTLLSHIRDKEKGAAADEGVKLTYLPFIIKAVIGALRRDPHMNSEMAGDEIVLKGFYNVGIATETPDGLIVPNVKDADRKSVLELAREIERLTRDARERTLDLSDLRGGTFTITNFGSIGGIFSTPILHYPQAGILGVGRINEKPLVLDGAIKVRKVMPLSLTFNHRIVDGATAQHFLNNVVTKLEDPDLLLIGG